MLIDNDQLDDFEIVVGIVAPIGTGLDVAMVRLGEALHGYGYRTEEIRLSDLLTLDKRTSGYYERRMNAGDLICRDVGSADAVAGLAVSRMQELRGGDERERRVAWVLRSLKREEEVELLRRLFGARFVLLGVQAPEDDRRSNLLAALRDESPGAKDLSSDVERLIARDHMDDTNKFGQRVRDTFALADFFMDMSLDSGAQLTRFIELLFGEPFDTPMRDESSMFHAYAASLRSSDPGRQVGAVLATESGDILAIGTNEVPKSGGGEYWAGDEGDARDFRSGFDNNKREMRRVLAEVLDVLAEEGHLDPRLGALTSSERLADVWASTGPALKATRIMSLVEFGRIVHAEMSALMQAARSNIDVRGTTLFTTAFPCHLCMRLVVAAGISRVVYVDPYPKSLALDMYSDSVSATRVSGRVWVTPYSGVGWKIYPSVFGGRKRPRDESGMFESRDKQRARYVLAGADPLVGAQAEGFVASAVSVARDKTESNKDTSQPEESK